MHAEVHLMRLRAVRSLARLHDCSCPRKGPPLTVVWRRHVLHFVLHGCILVGGPEQGLALPDGILESFARDALLVHTCLTPNCNKGPQVRVFRRMRLVSCSPMDEPHGRFISSNDHLISTKSFKWNSTTSQQVVRFLYF